MFFSQCAALRCKLEMRGFPQSKSLSLHRADWTPLLALLYPPSAPFITLPHCDQQLTFLLPFIVCPFSHISNTRVYYQKKKKNLTIHHVYTHSLGYLHSASCQVLFPNQKQTAISRVPSLLSHTGDWVYQSVASRFSGHFIRSEGRGCKMPASRVKDLTPLQTQHH